MDEFDYPELYDAANTWGADDDFYLSLAESVGGPVLDLGCGTGRLTHAIADRGIEVTGVDRSRRMLRHARQRPSKRAIHWVQGDVRAFGFRRRFSLILMTSHVWQFLLTDGDQRTGLMRVREHLTANGLLAFETRPRPLGAEYKERHTRRFEDGSGRAWSIEVGSRFDEETSVDSTVLTYQDLEGGGVTTVRNRLRLTPVSQLDGRLRSAGFTVVERFGDWDRTPYTGDSPEIITVAAAAGARPRNSASAHNRASRYDIGHG